MSLETVFRAQITVLYCLSPFYPSVMADWTFLHSLSAGPWWTEVARRALVALLIYSINWVSLRSQAIANVTCLASLTIPDTLPLARRAVNAMPWALV